MGAGHNSGWNALSCTLKILSTFLYVVILYVLKKKKKFTLRGKKVIPQLQVVYNFPRTVSIRCRSRWHITASPLLPAQSLSTVASTGWYSNHQLCKHSTDGFTHTSFRKYNRSRRMLTSHFFPPHGMEEVTQAFGQCPLTSSDVTLLFSLSPAAISFSTGPLPNTWACSTISHLASVMFLYLTASFWVSHRYLKSNISELRICCPSVFWVLLLFANPLLVLSFLVNSTMIHSCSSQKPPNSFLPSPLISNPSVSPVKSVPKIHLKSTHFSSYSQPPPH